MDNLWIIYGYGSYGYSTGGFNMLTYPSETYEFVNWDDDIPNIWENKKCSKPPTSYGCSRLIVAVVVSFFITCGQECQ